MFKWLENGMSIDETRVSTLMFVFVVVSGFSLWQYANVGSIDGSMLTFLAYLIGAITGINIVDKVKNGVGK